MTEENYVPYRRRVAKPKPPIKVRYIIPPLPTSIYLYEPDKNGYLLRWMSPLQGKIDKFRLVIEELVLLEGVKKGKIQVTYRTAEKLLGYHDLLVEQGMNELEGSLDIRVGDIVDISVLEGTFRGIWLSFAFYPHISEETIKLLVLDPDIYKVVTPE